MRARSLLSLAPLALSLCAVSCGQDFLPASSIDSLRVLAIQSSEPLATPGTTAHLSMLWYDGSPKAVSADGSRREVSITWFGGCENPASDAFYQCFSYVNPSPPAGSPAVLGAGATFDLPISADILAKRGTTAGRANTYGLAMVLYAACGGHLVPITPTDQSQPPVACVDDTGAALTEQDFVFGYLPIYVYDPSAGIATTNPVVTGATFDGRSDAPATCDASSPCANGDHCGIGGLCEPVIPHCTAHYAKDCPTYSFVPSVDMSSIERDTVALAEDHVSQVETLFVDYYTTQGGLNSASRNINAPNLGWNSDFSTTLYGPDHGGTEARVFAVVHNNRGGVAWVFRDIYIQ